MGLKGGRVEELKSSRSLKEESMWVSLIFFWAVWRQGCLSLFSEWQVVGRL